MKKNMGGADRGFRFVLGAAIVGAGLYFGSWWGVVGVIPLATSLLGTCPAYLPFGFNTCRTGSPGG